MRHSPHVDIWVLIGHAPRRVKAVVAIAKAVSDAYPDPKDRSGRLMAAVDVAPVRKLPRPVTLAEIKARPSFKDFPLVRISRLSVMPVSEKEWSEILKMSEQGK